MPYVIETLSGQPGRAFGKKPTIGVICIKAKNAFFKASAGKLLAEKYGKFFVSTLMFCTVTAGFSTIGSLFVSLVPEDSPMLVTVSFTFMLLLTVLSVPIFLGYLAFVTKTVRGEDVTLTELFVPYSSFSEFCRSLGLLMRLLGAFLLKIVLPCGAVNFLYDIFVQSVSENIFGEDSPVALIGFCFGIVLAGAAAFCMLYFFSKNIAETYYFSDGKSESIDEAIRRAKFAMNGRKGDFFLLSLSFIPLLVLTLLSFGILGVVYTLPFITVCRALFFESAEKWAIASAKASAPYGRTRIDGNMIPTCHAPAFSGEYGGSTDTAGVPSAGSAVSGETAETAGTPDTSETPESSESSESPETPESPESPEASEASEASETVGTNETVEAAENLDNIVNIENTGDTREFQVYNENTGLGNNNE